MSSNEHRHPADCPDLCTDDVRHRGTDRQDHVNNTVFSTFLESARTSFLDDPKLGVKADGCEFVIVRLEIDFRKEISWSSGVRIGTSVAGLGRSSVTLEQAIFQNGVCVATSRNVMVMIDAATRRSVPFSQNAVTRFQEFR